MWQKLDEESIKIKVKIKSSKAFPFFFTWETLFENATWNETFASILHNGSSPGVISSPCDWRKCLPLSCLYFPDIIIIALSTYTNPLELWEFSRRLKNVRNHRGRGHGSADALQNKWLHLPKISLRGGSGEAAQRTFLFHVFALWPFKVPSSGWITAPLLQLCFKCFYRQRLGTRLTFRLSSGWRPANAETTKLLRIDVCCSYTAVVSHQTSQGIALASSVENSC